MDLTSLIAYWGLDEVSDGSGPVVRNDRHVNGLFLSDPLNAGTDTGLVYPLAAKFVRASNDVLYRNSEALLQMGNIDWEICAWVKQASKPAADMSIVSKGDYPNEAYRLMWHQANDRFRIQTYNSTGESGTQLVDANTLGSPATGTWYFLDASYIAATGQLVLIVNSTNVDADAGGGSGAYVETGEFDIGLTSNINSSWFDGDIGPVLIWKRLLTTSERTFLYNGGAGRTYAEMTGTRFVLVPS